MRELTNELSIENYYYYDPLIQYLSYTKKMQFFPNCAFAVY